MARTKQTARELTPILISASPHLGFTPVLGYECVIMALQPP